MRKVDISSFVTSEMSAKMNISSENFMNVRREKQVILLEFFYNI